MLDAPTRRARVSLAANRRTVAFLIVLLLNLIVAAFLIDGVLSITGYPFDADEANHALPALRMSNELRDGDLAGFAAEVGAQDFYPPGGAARLLPIFLMIGPSVNMARLASVVTLFLAVLVLFALAIEIDPENGWLAGLVAALMTLTARPLLLYAGLSMLETVGLLASLLFLWAYIRATKQPGVGWLLAVSLLLAAVFLIKYSYGLVALATVGLSELLILPGLIRQPSWPSTVARRWLPLFGPFALVLGVWFLSPGQLQSFFGYAQPLAAEEAWLSLRNVIYYPRSLALHYSPSLLFIIVYGVALVWATLRWRDTTVRIVLLFFLFGMASVMFLNHPPNPRFIAPFAPVAHLLVGLMVANLWAAVRARKSRWQVAAVGLAVVVVLAVAGLSTVASRFRFAHSVLEARVETSPALADMAGWVASTVEADAPLLLVNYFDQFSPAIVEWGLAMDQQATPAHVTGRLLQPASDAETAALRQAVLDGDDTYLVLVEGSPWGAPFWPDYTAAMGDVLQEVDRQSFRVVNFGASNWLDDNSVGADWETVKAAAEQTIDVTLVVYRITRS